MAKLWIALLCLPLCLGAFQISEEHADALFLDEFKSDSFCKKFFEPTSPIEGRYYIKDIFYYYDDLFPLFKRFKENDSIGRPKLTTYKKVGAISPSTLRWIKTAADLRSYFGPLSTFNILYVGAGYGGICKILSDLGEWGNVTILEEKGVALLCQQYLHKFGLTANFKTPDDLLHFEDYDLLLIDADFLTSKCDPSWLLEAATSIPRGLIIKRGIPDQFNSLVSALIAKGAQGKIKGDLFWKENVRQQLFWKPAGEFRGKPLKEEVKAIPSEEYQQGCAISSFVNNGRLGDHLLDYFCALWLARAEGLPFFYQPFKFSGQFALSEISLRTGKHYLYRRQKELIKIAKTPFEAESTLWVLPHVSKERLECEQHGLPSWCQFVDWNHPEFREEIRNHLTPLKPVSLVYPPEGYLSIALHLRKGGAFKSDYGVYHLFPLRFPPDAFILEQLKRVAHIFPDRPIYIYLFTDDLDPEKLAKSFEVALGEERAVFDWGRNGALSAEERMLSDFHSFQNFDCLIRPASHFSFMGGLLGDFSLEISPCFYHEKKDGTFVYDQVQILFRGKSGDVIE